MNKAIERPTYLITKPVWQDCWLVFYVDELGEETNQYFTTKEDAEAFIKEVKADPNTDCSDTPVKRRRKV